MPIADVDARALMETREGAGARAQAALAGTDMRSVVRERHVSYEQELKRRHVPRVLLSDGTEPGTETHAAGSADGTLRGAPASAGVVTGKARVILDPTGARLEPGEILVAPSTDPGWTPLFLTAGGLVMEMGGMISRRWSGCQVPQSGSAPGNGLRSMGRMGESLLSRTLCVSFVIIVREKYNGKAMREGKSRNYRCFFENTGEVTRII